MEVILKTQHMTCITCFTKLHLYGKNNRSSCVIFKNIHTLFIHTKNIIQQSARFFLVKTNVLHKFFNVL